VEEGGCEEMLMKSKQNTLVGFVALSLVLYGTATTAQVKRFVPAMAAVVPGTSMKPDQMTAARWDKAWTNLVNDAEQSFTPSLPRLLGVEVELVVANPGPADDELTLTVMDMKGQTLAVVTQTVQASDCEHTLFVIPKDGIDVIPGQAYRLKLSGETLFGWKYCRRQIRKRRRDLQPKAALPKARSTFLFQTFGIE
jgi:hypothetical protein